MAPAAPQLPSKFPCWCRAVYSWGGETKKDLGFVEGDLIECLNAGDGQWWTGRLRRDRRMIGLFPSNFVEVLGEDFVPVNRTATPLVIPNPSPLMNPTAGPKKQKTVFRKPFQAHKEALPPSLVKSGLSRSTTDVSSSIPRTPPRAGAIPRSVKPLRTNTTPSAAKPRATRPPSPARPSPPISRPPPRAVSPVPVTDPEVTPTPEVPAHRPSQQNTVFREISPLVLEDHEPVEREESPPPPPPPHRVAVNPRPSPATEMQVNAPARVNDEYLPVSSTPSPVPPSDGNGHTPSPLRDAMNGVMSSLQDMGVSGRNSALSRRSDLSNPWSPDDYNSVHETEDRAPEEPSLPSLDFREDHDQIDDGSQIYRQNSIYNNDTYLEGPPQLNNYVQRMESRLRQMQEQNRRPSYEGHFPDDEIEEEPPPPPKHTCSFREPASSGPVRLPRNESQRSARDVQEDILNRSSTNKSTATTSTGKQSNLTSGTDETNGSLMSGPSAGSFSASSAVSLSRRGTGRRPNTAMDTSHSRGFSDLGRPSRPGSPVTSVSYHSSHNTSRQGASSAIPWSSSNEDDNEDLPAELPGVFGGLSTPKAKKQGFFKKILESAKSGAATAKSFSPTKSRSTTSAASGRSSSRDIIRDMGLGSSSSAVDWVQVRRDVNRATSPSRHEKIERAERCQMMDYPVIYAVEELQETAEGDESIDGLPISEPSDFLLAGNLSLVDKSARFVTSLPPLANPTTVAQGYICRPYRTDVQRLRAIFTWVSEKVVWDEPDDDVEVDIRRVLYAKRGSPQAVAMLVQEMCSAVGLHAEMIQGFLKTPGQPLDLDSLSRPNHWWNAVLLDGEWRIMDCSLASPTNPQRHRFVTGNSQTAEDWYFLTRPLEICYTHVPLFPEEQHICPPVSPDVLLALPTVCPPFFKNNMQIPDYDTSLSRLEGLEVMQIRLIVPPDTEYAAEVETHVFAHDDGGQFATGDISRKRALVQPDWVGDRKRVTVKAILPCDEGQGILNIYAGRKGHMYSSREIPHPLALALPITHTGENTPYEFVLRHPTPHAQRHDLYIMQPQCAKLAVNNTFVFAVRQHPASSVHANGNDPSANERGSPAPSVRPSSSLSMISSSAGGSGPSNNSNEFSASTSAVSSRSGTGREKPAKLAIQSPSGKIMRLTRKGDHSMSFSNASDSLTEVSGDGSVWETVIKISECGIWRGLVLADRVARWCVFCEWECI